MGWVNLDHSASVTSGTSAKPDGLFDAGVHTQGYTLSFILADAGIYPYFYRLAPTIMIGFVTVGDATPTPTPTPTLPGR